MILIKASLTDFLEEVSLLTDIDRWNNENKAVTLMTLHTAKGLELSMDNDELSIDNEGSIVKAVQNVDEITFSPKLQKEYGHEILIITERCVFEIENGQVKLIEIAPGIDLQQDIINKMEFEPIIHTNLKA